jgi:hypothetical protein
LPSLSPSPQSHDVQQHRRHIADGVRRGRRIRTSVRQPRGRSCQGQGAVAIGREAGKTGQGVNSVAIGSFAGQTSQQDNSIVITASGAAVNAPYSGCYITPIRLANATGISANLFNLIYDNNSGEFVKSTVACTSSKSFVIDHPLDKDKYLVHVCLEGPEAGVYYRGKAKITNERFVKIDLPDYTKEWYDFTINVTAIGKPRVCGADEVFNGSFLIYGESGVYHWTVYAKRQEINVEPLKSETNVQGSGPYRWIS